MLIRFFLLICVLGGGFAYFQYVAPQATKQKAIDFVQNINTSGKTKVEETTTVLLEKKESLTTTLQNLQAQIVDKAEAGVDKYEEISLRIEETKAAIQQVDQSLQNLKESVGIPESQTE